jgi:hypothetical protein
MNILRSIGAVLAGYLVFGLSTALLFTIMRQDPHAAAATVYIVGATIYGAVFGAIGGFLTAWIATWRRMIHVAILAGVIAGVAAVSMLTRASDEPLWSQLAAMLVIAPAAIVGGWIRVKSLPPDRQEDA